MRDGHVTRIKQLAAQEFSIEPPRAVMSSSFAFGGSNVVLIAQRD